MKHDNISSPGVSDQEKEMATNAFEAFNVTNYNTVVWSSGFMHEY